MTDEERLADFSRNIRAWIGQFAALMNQADAGLKAAYATGDPDGIHAILDAMSPGDVVEDNTGLAGADELDVADVMAIAGYMGTVLNVHNTTARREQYARVAGGTNIV